MEITESLRRYFNDIGPIPLLQGRDERRLCLLAKTGDMGAWQQLVKSNLKLVVTIAKDYEGYGLSLEDLIAEGNTGLMEAARRVDPDKGAKFSTYAAYWIKQSVRRALANQRATIRVPASMGDKIRSMRRVEGMLEEELHRRPTLRDMSDALGIAEADIAKLKEVGQSQISLDMPLTEDSGNTAMTIEDESAERPDEAKERSEIVGILDRVVFSELDERERNIIELRYGLGGVKPQTLEEIGRLYGVTRERIRQVQNIALNKLRDAMRKRDASVSNNRRGVMMMPMLKTPS
ncbi:MAG: RNA polymerase sigma factor RpoD/SigA [Verrucomicrobiales bacterium]|nr:RNA polymerase sigma factor RpoD/SigA [Verrucomicrobiales bacterium]